MFAAGVVSLLLPWAAACSSDKPASTSVRVMGTATGTFKGESCRAEGDEVKVIVDATGDLGALGPSSVHIDLTALCGGPGVLRSLTHLVGVYTTKNGDELRFSGNGTTITFDTSKGTVASTLSDQYAGGTGRFASATGSEQIALSHSISDNVLTLRIDGTASL
jgi:hypothetical protein